MTEFDPFEDIEDGVEPTPSDEAPEKKPAAITVDVKPKLQPLETGGKVVLTFKCGSGYEAPWIVVHADDLDDAYNHVHGEGGSKLSKLMERVYAAGKFFTGLAGDSQAKPVRESAPSPAKQPPAGSPPCPGEGWAYKSGVNKNGKPWQAWLPPRGSDETPVWF